MATFIAKDTHQCSPRSDYERQGHAPQIVRVSSCDSVGGSDFERTWWTFDGEPHAPIIRWCPYCGKELHAPADVAARYAVVLEAGS